MSPRPRIVSPYVRHTPPVAALPDRDARTALDFDLTPDLEALLNALAHAGRNDPAARNELYARLSGKIPRFLAPWHPGAGGRRRSATSPTCNRKPS